MVDQLSIILKTPGFSEWLMSWVQLKVTSYNSPYQDRSLFEASIDFSSLATKVLDGIFF
jgi:hypothetical protein